MVLNAIKKDTDVGRFYIGDNFVFPSVTTISGFDSNTFWLDRWKNKIGEDEAEKISKRARNRGTVLHGMIEDHFFKSFNSSKIFEFDEEEIKAGKNLFSIIEDLFVHIEEPLSSESVVYHRVHKKKGYSGTLDFSAKIDGHVKIVDFKGSLKPKSKKSINGYFEQVSAYCHAYHYMHSIMPLAEIWIACETGQAQRFILSKEEISMHYSKFLSKLNAFFSKYLLQISQIQSEFEFNK